MQLLASCLILNAEKSFLSDTTSTGYFGCLNTILNSIFPMSLYLFGHNVEVSSGLNDFRSCALFTQNRNLHAVCSTDLFAIAPNDYFPILTDATVT